MAEFEFAKPELPLEEEVGSDVDQQQDMVLVTPEESDSFNLASDTPAQVEKHLDFIELNSKGHLLLGSSNLTGRYWCGSIWYYDTPSLAPSVERSKAGIEFTGGVADGLFIDDENVVVAVDGGLLEFASIDTSDDYTRINKTNTVSSHSSCIIGVQKTCDSSTIITASLDTSIRLWDSRTGVCKYIFSPAHTQELSDISAHPTQSDLFLSCGLDGNVLIWDTRLPKPASCIFRDIDDCPSAISWLSLDCGSTYDYLVGTMSGEMHLRNAEVLSHSLHSADFFERPLYRFKPNRFMPNQIAACADESKIIVINIEGEKLCSRYKDDSHNDFVRGFAWLEENKLLSCGWDKQVITHAV